MIHGSGVSWSLRTKIIALLSAIVLLFSLVDATVHRYIVLQEFDRLERESGLRELDRARALIDREVKEVDSIARDLRPWIEREIARGGEIPLGVSSDIEAVERTDFDVFLVCRGDGEVLWRRTVDPETRQETPLDAFPQEALPRSHLLLGDDPLRGLLRTERGALLVSARPLDLGASTGSRMGRLIVGRFLTPDRLVTLSEGAQTSLDAMSIDRTTLSAPEREIVDRVMLASEPIWDESSTDSLFVHDTLADVQGLPVVLLKVLVARGVRERGIASANDSLLSSIAVAVLLLLVLTKLLQSSVVGPLQRLTKHAIEIHRSDDMSKRFESARRDEIGVLAREFDTMVQELEKSRQDKVQMARVSGMSEVASGIVHNIGNVLNSVNVSAELVGRSIRKLPLDDLASAVRAVKSHEQDLQSYVTSDPRGKHLTSFLEGIEGELQRSCEAAASELDELALGIEHIQQLVASQPAARGLAREWTDLSDQVAAALRICQHVREDVEGIEFIDEYQPTEKLYLDRHRLMGILVNLIMNAIESLARSEGPRKQLGLRVCAGEDGGARIEVTDDGGGIPEEDLVRIFQPGFTTGENSQGLGLHMAAISADQMGGRIEVQSRVGQGATFVLTLPGSAAAKQQAA